MFKSQLRTKEEILAIRAAEEDYAKRTLLAQETVKLVREELANCYMEHGVNHKIACKGLREEYAKLVRDPTHGAGLPVSAACIRCVCVSLGGGCACPRLFELRVYVRCAHRL